MGVNKILRASSISDETVVGEEDRWCIEIAPIRRDVLNFQYSFQSKQMRCKDERIKITNEVMGGIKVDIILYSNYPW